MSRRPSREYFKCGALNKAMEQVMGDFVLLLDADSIVPPDVLSKGIDAMESHPRASFVSFRYGHYNRNYNMITRLFALYQDIGDTLSKMGAYRIDAPFSFQGGFALVRAKDLREVGQWSNERIADDGDVSIKMYLAGKRGIYLSSVKIMSEDPSTLEAWKKQVARTSQGWWRCIAKYWRGIIAAPDVSLEDQGRAPADAAGSLLGVQLDHSHVPIRVHRDRRSRPACELDIQQPVLHRASRRSLRDLAGVGGLGPLGAGPDDRSQRHADSLPRLRHGRDAQPRVRGLLLRRLRQDRVLRVQDAARRFRRGYEEVATSGT